MEDGGGAGQGWMIPRDVRWKSTSHGAARNGLPLYRGRQESKMVNAPSCPCLRGELNTDDETP